MREYSKAHVLARILHVDTEVMDEQGQLNSMRMVLYFLKGPRSLMELRLFVSFAESISVCAAYYSERSGENDV